MAKYIIDIPEDRIGDFVGSTCLLMPFTMAKHKGVHNTNLKLTPYTEPDRKAIEDEVWEFVRIITDMTEKQRIECFGGLIQFIAVPSIYSSDKCWWMVSHHSMTCFSLPFSI